MSRRNPFESQVHSHETPPLPAAQQELMQQIQYHLRKIQELLGKLGAQQINGLYKKNNITTEQFRAALRLPHQGRNR